MRFAVIVAAAGSGSRLGADVPKAFIPVAGKPLLVWSLATFAQIEGLSEVIVAGPPGWEERAGALTEPYGGRVVSGGGLRQESVWEALRAVGEGIELVAVHDAARPLVAPEDVRMTLEAARRVGGAILARPVTDTLKEVAGERIVGGADRERLWRAETPQVFVPSVLREAYRRWPGGLATDEAQMVKAAGGEVCVVGARSWNPKVTFPADLELLEVVLGAPL